MRISAAAFLLVILISDAVYALPIPRQQLVKGKAVSLETEYEVGDVAVSDSSRLDFMVTENRREIYLNPREEGVVTLTIWDGGGIKKDVVPVEITNSDLQEIKEEAEAVFKDTNVDVSADRRGVSLSGEASSKIEVEQARLFAERHPEVQNSVKLSGEILGTIAEKVEAAIGIPGIKVREVRGRLVLDGVAFSSAAAKKAVEIAGMYEPDIVNMIDVRETGRRPGKERLIKLDFYFMEIKKEALRSLGINWAPGAMPKKAADSGSSGGSGLFGGIADLGSTVLGFVFNLIPKLKFMNEKGNARVLENASFVVKSAEAADLFNGTQVPYYSGDNVVFKDVGIKIHAEPIAAGSDVDLNLATTLTSLAANIEGGIDTRTINTSAYVNAGYSLLLSNVVSNRDIKNYNRKPANIDTSSALFDLTLSKDFQTGRSEFVVFVVPTILDERIPAEEELRNYLETEKAIIKDRSKKEYAEFIGKDGPKTPEQKKRNRKKW